MLPQRIKQKKLKEQFYEDLQNITDKAPKSHTIIILGDVNVKLGKEKVYKKITGGHTLHEDHEHTIPT